MGLLVVLVVGLILALFFGLAIGQGAYQEVYIYLVLACLVPVFFFVGDKYWMIIPFAMLCGLPAIPLYGGRSLAVGELAVLAGIVAFGLRIPFTRRFTLFHRSALPVYLYFGIVALVFLSNPVGVAILGSSQFGARFYLQIGLAFACFIIFINQEVTENRAKWLVITIVAAGAIHGLFKLLQFFVFGGLGAENYSLSSTADFYSWHQYLSLIAVAIALYLFSRGSLLTMWKRHGIPFILILLFAVALAAISGKRQFFALVLIYPAIASLLNKEYAFVMGWGMLMLIGLAFVLIGHGRIFEFPLSVQRSMAFLPGKWNSRVERSTDNLFRETLIRMATDEIRRNPVLGKGYGLTVQGYYTSGTLAGMDEHQLAGTMAVGGSWHNTWMGIAADFGIPAAIVWALIWIQMLRISYKAYQQAEPGSRMKQLAALIFLITAGAVLRSWTTGHSAINFWEASWQFGLVLCLKMSLDRAQAEKAEAREEARAPVMGFPERNAI